MGEIQEVKLQAELAIKEVPYAFASRVNSLNLRINAVRPSDSFYYIANWDAV